MKDKKVTIRHFKPVRKFIIPCMLCYATLLPMILSGCGNGIAPGYEESQLHTTITSDQEVPPLTWFSTETSVNTAVDSVPDRESTPYSQENERTLTQEELRQFTYFINEGDTYSNYGFLLSEYSIPQKADLNEILYNGTGQPASPMTNEEKEAYSKATGLNVDTDCIKLSAEMIDEFLMKKMNLNLGDFTSVFSWVYLKEFDCWYNVHGDTNYTTFTCASGKQIGDDIIQLEYAADIDYYSDCLLTLKKTGDSYLFVSNSFIPRIENTDYIWLIEDQTFDVNLNEWGNVTFASYEPDFNKNPTGDVTFSLMLNGKAIFQFPSVFTDNVRSNADFEGIEAVGFKDYNEDGYMDVMIICQYAPVSGPDVSVPYNEIRLYKGEEKNFWLDSDLSDLLNSKNKNQSITEAAKHIQEYYPGGFIPREE